MILYYDQSSSHQLGPRDRTTGCCGYETFTFDVHLSTSIEPRCLLPSNPRDRYYFTEADEFVIAGVAKVVTEELVKKGAFPSAEVVVLRVVWRVRK